MGGLICKMLREALKSLQVVCMYAPILSSQSVLDPGWRCFRPLHVYVAALSRSSNCILRGLPYNAHKFCLTSSSLDRRDFSCRRFGALRLRWRCLTPTACPQPGLHRCWKRTPLSSTVQQHDQCALRHMPPFERCFQACSTMQVRHPH